MAHHWSEGVSTLRFTAREFQQELVEEALKHNLLTFPSSSAAFFVSLKVIQELAYQIRGIKKKTVIVSPIYKLKSTAFDLSHLTDLQTTALHHVDNNFSAKDFFSNHQVIVCTSEVLENLFSKNVINMSHINLLIIEHCHLINDDKKLQQIMKRYITYNKNTPKLLMTPRILAFSYPLFTPHNDENVSKISLNTDKILQEFPNDPFLDRATILNECDSKAVCHNHVELECLKSFTDLSSQETEKQSIEMNSFQYWHIPCSDIATDLDKKEILTDKISQRSPYEVLECRLERLENYLCCKIDMASDVVGLKRITGKPKEVIIECKPFTEDDKCDHRKQLESYMKNTIAGALLFLKDHRYDPTEIYGDEVYDEELRAIPDPRNEPKDMLELFLYILEQAGPYAADKAAFALLVKIEKMKIKIPYERHFLLLCLVSSIFIQVRAAAELIFERYPNEKDRIILFTTPKVLRLMDVLKLFKPSEIIQKNIENSPKIFNKTQKNKNHSFNNPKQKEHQWLAKCKNDTQNCIQMNSKYKIKTLENDCPEENSINKQIEKDDDILNIVVESENIPINEPNLENTTNTEEKGKSTIIDKKSDSSKLKNSTNFNLNVSLKDIEKCDFKKLELKIEENCVKILNSSIENDVNGLQVSCAKNSIEKTINISNLSVVSDKTNQDKNDPETVQDVVKNEGIQISIDKSSSLINRTAKLATKETQLKKYEPSVRGRGRGRGGKGYGYQNRYHNNNNDPDALCGLIFVEEPMLAKILSSIINEYCRNDDGLRFVCAQYTIDKVADPLTDIKEAETEHKLQEEVLKRFRIHECNLLVGTSFLEEGMDLPKCNLVMRWDVPNGYRSYARSRARARAPRSLFALLMLPPPEPLITSLAQYSYIEKMLVNKCGWQEPPASEEAYAAKFTALIEAYRPSSAAVSLSSAVALLNRYCAKLPSDTFTRLVPLWTTEEIKYRGSTLFICTIRLPINCPLKHHIVGHPMPNRVLARRTAALQACRALHRAGELDDNLMPIGKEGFRAMESDWLSLPPASDLPKTTQNVSTVGKDVVQNDLNDNFFDGAGYFEPRPGTTKRKQYYYKKVAQALTDCRPMLGEPCLAYQINAWLACPLPERHNTRGRKLHPPESYAEGFAILTSKPIQKIPVFPIFTRSGEVRVALQQLPGSVIISKKRQRLIHYFMKYTFAEVLRVHNHLMLFDDEGKQSRNSYYIVPTSKITRKDGRSSVVIDWSFLQLIYEQTNADSISILENKVINNKPFSNSENVLDNTCSLKKKNNLNEKEKNTLNGYAENNVNEFNNKQIADSQTTEDNDVKNKNLINKSKTNDFNEIEIKEEDKQNDNYQLLNKTSEGIHDKNCNLGSCAANDPIEENLPNPYLNPNEVFQFNSEKFRDAVVMPWYRNQDQPQYFYVAEICWNLSPRSAFPSAQHATFEEYYRHKYGVKITQPSQPLLDVDHTSARLNLLTPRFVNRKGVALPTSSERTKRAKRESLEQKQILVPELCCAHPFRGALWRAAVALPCILYRINSLLLADEIRKSVALCVALGKPNPETNFEWPSLDFGWSLAEVLAGDSSKENKNGCQKSSETKTSDIEENKNKDGVDNGVENIDGSNAEKSANEILKEKEEADTEGTDAFEIGMWSNDMASNVPNIESEDGDFEDEERSMSTTKLPENLTICTSIGGGADWNLIDNETASPKKNGRDINQKRYSVAGSDISYGSSDFEMSDDSSGLSDTDTDEFDLNVNASDAFSEKSGIRIEFKSGNEAEAIEISTSNSALKIDTDKTVDVEVEREIEEKSMALFKDFFYNHNNDDEDTVLHVKKFENAIIANEEKLKNNGILIKFDHSLEILKPQNLSGTHAQSNMDYSNKPCLKTCKPELIETLSVNIVKNVDSNPSDDFSNLDFNPKKITDDKTCVELENTIDMLKDNEDNVNPFPETFELALSKDEILELYNEMFPYETVSQKDQAWYNIGLFENGHVTLDNLEKNKRKILDEIKMSIDCDKWLQYNFFSMKDLDEENFESSFKHRKKGIESTSVPEGNFCSKANFKFSFDYQPDLENHPGPSPSLILQALTMSNANDGINLERLETIGDSFLKYAITTYLYCTYQNIHEGKLSHLRSKQVSNLNLYRLGRRKSLGSRMVAYKFEPHDNWLPPCHRVPPHLERALIDTHIPSSLWNIADMPRLTGLSKDEIEKLVRERVAHYHTIPSKIKNNLNERIEDENCIFHGKNSKLIKDLTLSCYESASRMEMLKNDQNSRTNSTLDNEDFAKNCHVQSCAIPLSPMKSVAKDGSFKCTCVVVSYKDSENMHDDNKDSKDGEYVKLEGVPCFVPYNLITQHSIPDKSVADCVEALIGAYLIECGPRGALLFMAWLGIRVLPREEIVLSNDHPFVKAMKDTEVQTGTDRKIVKMKNNAFYGPVDKDSLSEDSESAQNKRNTEDVEQDPYDCQDENSDFDELDDWNWDGRVPGSLKPKQNSKGEWIQVVYGILKPPPSPLLRYVPDPEGELMQMLSGYEGLERTLNYRFKDRCYLLQAMTHASYSPNRLTDCYQRLEFLGDAVLDYLITRQLYEDPRRHSPGALTDLRSALVNNTIFASLAVRHGMHKYFRHLSPGLNEVLSRFVKIQEENGHSISEDHYLIQEDECEQAEDVEVPKALGDLFESIAGAIFLDSGMSLDAVWKVYHALMQREIEAFSESVPKSPVRELLEMEPETAKFGKPEKLADGRRVRVTVEVLGIGVFKGVGRNYRIAKCTAAKCALRRLASSTRRHKTK